LGSIKEEKKKKPFGRRKILLKHHHDRKHGVRGEVVERTSTSEDQCFPFKRKGYFFFKAPG